MRKSKKNRFIAGDNWLMRCIMFFLAILVIVQALLLNDGIRIHLSEVDKMEGSELLTEVPLYVEQPIPLTEETTFVNQYKKFLRKHQIIDIRLVKPSANYLNINIMVNGKKVDDFNKGDVKLTVFDGDYVEIDATAVKQPIKVIIKVPAALSSPVDGIILEGAGQILEIGKIKFKND